ncbi:hypothetical protein GCM10010521_31800 [Streptomyces rameus]|uniref:Uncharacterized protein n=1 Tax=Streptomyces rameus TaxID=68261 RepID=A0ABP6NBE0_9ACTN
MRALVAEQHEYGPGGRLQGVGTGGRRAPLDPYDERQHELPGLVAGVVLGLEGAVTGRCWNVAHESPPYEAPATPINARAPPINARAPADRRPFRGLAVPRRPGGGPGRRNRGPPMNPTAALTRLDHLKGRADEPVFRDR